MRSGSNTGPCRNGSRSISRVDSSLNVRRSRKPSRGCTDRTRNPGLHFDFRAINILPTLFQRCDSLQGLTSASAFPVLQKLGPIQGQPLLYQPPRPRGQLAFLKHAVRNSYQRGLAAIVSVKVWLMLLIEIHAYCDPVESADCGHREIQRGTIIQILWAFGNLCQKSR
jgi:hypothetical protein